MLKVMQLQGSVSWSPFWLWAGIAGLKFSSETSKAVRNINLLLIAVFLLGIDFFRVRFFKTSSQSRLMSQFLGSLFMTESNWF